MGDSDNDFWVRPKGMEWSNNASLALIEEYRRQPVLWDTKHHSYSCKGSKKQKAWDTIASNMQMDVLEIKQKMNSLLGSFRRERSRIKKSSEQGGSYFPRWFAFEKMLFLRRGEETDLSDVVIKFEEEENFNFEEFNDVTQEPIQNDKRTSSTTPTVKRQRRKSIGVSPSPTGVSTTDDFSNFPQQDEYTIFSQYIACKLRKYDHRTSAIVQHAINNIIFEADMGKYNNMQLPFVSSHESEEKTTSSNQIAST